MPTNQHHSLQPQQYHYNVYIESNSAYGNIVSVQRSVKCNCIAMPAYTNTGKSLASARTPAIIIPQKK